jgi:hypothetical protein
LKRIQNVVRKWAEDKWNEGVLKQVNNQAPIVGPAHEQKRVRITSKGTFVRNKINSYLCNWSIKENCI